MFIEQFHTAVLIELYTDKWFGANFNIFICIREIDGQENPGKDMLPDIYSGSEG